MFKFLDFFKDRSADKYSQHPQAWIQKSFGDQKEISFQMFASTRPRYDHYGIPLSGFGKNLGYVSANHNIMPLLLERKKGFELGAIKAKVLVNGQEGLYLPMIDFVGRPTEYECKVLLNKIISSIPSLQGQELVLFDSTNSYHGYIFKLITKHEWEEFLYTLKECPFVDQEWVSNSSVKCLRWTKELGKHLPRFAFSVGDSFNESQA